MSARWNGDPASSFDQHTYLGFANSQGHGPAGMVGVHGLLRAVEALVEVVDVGAGHPGLIGGVSESNDESTHEREIVNVQETLGCGWICVYVYV